MDTNFIFALNEAVRLTPKPEVRKQMQFHATEVRQAIAHLGLNATKATMQDLVGAWTRAQKALDAYHAPETPPPRAGAGTLEHLAEAT